MDFYVPSYLEQDFDDILLSLGEDCTINFTSATPILCKALIEDLDFKSNMKGLSDTSKLFTCSKSIDLKKGDYVTDTQNHIYLVNWFPFRAINCNKTQIQLCTVSLDFQRWTYAELDADGIASTPASFIDISLNTYGFVSRVNARAWMQNEGTIGIEASQTILVGVQYNDDTKNLMVTDEFNYYGSQYMIYDIDYSQLNCTNVDGVLMLYCKIIDGDKHD